MEAGHEVSGGLGVVRHGGGSHGVGGCEREVPGHRERVERAARRLGGSVSGSAVEGYLGVAGSSDSIRSAIANPDRVPLAPTDLCAMELTENDPIEIHKSLTTAF